MIRGIMMTLCGGTALLVVLANGCYGKRKTPAFVHLTAPKMAKVETKRYAADKELGLKPDVLTEASIFSIETALHFASMSEAVYKPAAEAEGLVKGNATCAGLGYDHFQWFEADPQAASTSFVDEIENLFDGVEDTEAMIAVNDDVIVVTFRGTKEAMQDWSANLKVAGKPEPIEWGLNRAGLSVHSGFKLAVDSVWGGENGMYSTIKKLYNEKGKNRKLFLTGHSLGGALATVTAAHLMFVDDMDIAAVYPIGSPKVFNDDLAEVFNEHINHGVAMKDKFFRCRNNNDVVTRMPLGYEHVGTEIYFNQHGTIGTSSALDLFLGRMRALLDGNILKGVNDHAMSEYIRLLAANLKDSQLSSLDKAASLVQDVAMKVVDPQKAEQRSEEVKATQIKAMEDAERELTKSDGN